MGIPFMEIYSYCADKVRVEEVPTIRKGIYTRLYKRNFPEKLGRIAVNFIIQPETGPQYILASEAFINYKTYKYIYMTHMSCTYSNGAYIGCSVYRHVLPKKEIVKMINKELEQLKPK